MLETWEVCQSSRNLEWLLVAELENYGRLEKYQSIVEKFQS